jgi:selenocysteine lyase/cysteine desulfurase
VLTPADPRLGAGIGAFRLAGRSSLADNRALAERLLAEHGIFTVHRGGVAGGACVRATPGVFTTEAEIDALAAAVAALLRGT